MTSSTQSPRALFVCSEFPPGPGGIGTHACQLAARLQHLGWDLTVLTAQDYVSSEEIASFNRAQNFRVVSFPRLPGKPALALSRWRLVSRWIRSWNPDVMLATGTREVWLTAAVLHGKQTPWLAVGHGTEFGLAGLAERTLVRWAFQKATAVASVSQYTWQQMLDRGIQPKAGRIIHNGADDGKFRLLPGGDSAALRRELGLQDAHILLTVGNVTERKGQEVVIRSLPRILREQPNTHYLMAGLPTEKDKLLSLATELGVSEHIRFLGRVDSSMLVRLLNCCDVFVMTSRRTTGGDLEGFGIAVVEAALCGRPAVVSSNSGLAEAIIDGETGLCVAPEDEAATAEAILSVLRDPARRRQMGTAARQRAIREQTWEQCARKYDVLLRELAGLPTSVCHREAGQLA